MKTLEDDLFLPAEENYDKGFFKKEKDDLDDYDLIELYFKRKKRIKFIIIFSIITFLIFFLTISIVAYNTYPSENDLTQQNDFDDLNPEDYFN